MCSYACFAVQSSDDTLEAVAFFDIHFGKVQRHGLLLQKDLIFEIFHEVFHPLEFSHFSFNIEVLEIHEIFICGAIFIIRCFNAWRDITGYP